MKTVTSTFLKQNFGEVSQMAKDQVISVTKNGKAEFLLVPVDTYKSLYESQFQDPERFREIMESFSKGEVDRGEVMRVVGTTWYGDVLDIMHSLGLGQSVVSPETQDEMIEALNDHVFGKVKP